MDDSLQSNNVVAKTSTTCENASFHEVDRVVTAWMMDYSFISVTHNFKEKNTVAVQKAVKSLEVFTDGLDLEEQQRKKRLICGFLARIMDAKNLDVQYTLDEAVTPLMSAVVVWNFIKGCVADSNLYQTVKRLLFVQSVAVCLEKGLPSMAKGALKWFEQECDIPQKLRMKLAAIVDANDPYDSYLASSSFNRLLELIQIFLDTFLEEHPSDFLFQAGSKVFHARQEKVKPEPEAQETQMKTDEENSTDESQSKEEIPLHFNLKARPKRRLLGKNNAQLWRPDSAKKPKANTDQGSRLKVSRLSSRVESPKPPMDTSVHRKRKMWTSDEDNCLKAGVKMFGEGRWAQVLKEYDFGDRTSVMLKDRWRTLKKLCHV